MIHASFTSSSSDCGGGEPFYPASRGTSQLHPSQLKPTQARKLENTQQASNITWIGEIPSFFFSFFFIELFPSCTLYQQNGHLCLCWYMYVFYLLYLLSFQVIVDYIICSLRPYLTGLETRWRLVGDSSLRWLRRRLRDVSWRLAGSPGSRGKLKHVRFFFWRHFPVSSRYRRPG